MQSWNFPYMYLYNIPTYFADIDGISHSFYTHKPHDKQDVKVIWGQGQGHSRLQNKNIAYFKSKKNHIFWLKLVISTSI